MTEIKVTVSEDGSVEIDVNGVKGKSCEKYTEAITKALGGKITSDKKKPEYYEKNSVKAGA